MTIENPTPAMVEAAAQARANSGANRGENFPWHKLDPEQQNLEREDARAALAAAQAAPCEKCGGRGYVVYDAEWEPYVVKCDCGAAQARLRLRLGLEPAS